MSPELTALLAIRKDPPNIQQNRSLLPSRRVDTLNKRCHPLLPMTYGAIWGDGIIFEGYGMLLGCTQVQTLLRVIHPQF